MDTLSFQTLLQKINSAFFTSSKLAHIRKTSGPFSAEQIYYIIGQFTSNTDRCDVVNDLYSNQRILPMTCKDAERIVTMGVYSAEKRTILQKLSGFLLDKNDKGARDLLKRSFENSEKSWIDSVLDVAGPIVYPQGAGQIVYPQGAAVCPPQAHMYPSPGGMQYPPVGSVFPYPGSIPPAGAPDMVYPPMWAPGCYPPQPPHVAGYPNVPPAFNEAPPPYSAVPQTQAQSLYPTIQPPAYQYPSAPTEQQPLPMKQAL